MKVGVIDYGVGNLGSVLRALEELRVAPVLVNRAVDMHATDCLILPGVGNFADCARLLDEGGWTAALRDEVHTAVRAADWPPGSGSFTIRPGERQEARRR